MILADERNDLARAVRSALEARLPAGWGPPDLRIVVGGDGFLLHTIAANGFEHLYFGINAGHLGFLLNDVGLHGKAPDGDVRDGDWDGLARSLTGGAWQEHGFPLLCAEIELVGGSKTSQLAINDVYLERSTGQTANLSLTIDGTVVEQKLTADGLIFATALGSTAYSFSAGGTPMHPSLSLILVTPICSHRPRLPPFAIPPSAHAVVQVQVPGRRPVRAVVDGRSFENVERVTITLAAEPSVRLAYLDTHDFTRQMVRKIMNP